MSDDVTLYTDKDLVMCRWRNLTSEGLDAVDAAVKDTQSKLGAKIAFIAVLPSDAPLPDEEFRRRQKENLPWMQEMCSSICLVFEGSGLKAAALRSIAASAFLIMGNRTMHMCSSLDEAFTKSGLDGGRYLEVARARGIASS